MEWALIPVDLIALQKAWPVLVLPHFVTIILAMVILQVKEGILRVTTSCLMSCKMSWIIAEASILINRYLCLDIAWEEMW